MSFLGIDVTGLPEAASICLQIAVIDLLLSADNALMIALACRALPAEEARRATLIGTAGAIGLRVAMAALVMVLIEVPFLKIVAGTTLLVLAVRLTVEPDIADPPARLGRHSNLLAAVGAIILADAVMSLDNVVAIAALAQGSLLLMGIGLALSVPMLVMGSRMIRALLDQNRLLVTLGGMFLGSIAGQIGVSDPMVASWIDARAPALVFVVPAACAIFVLWESRILAATDPARDGGCDG